MVNKKNKTTNVVGVSIDELCRNGKIVDVRSYGKAQERVLKYLRQVKQGMAQNDIGKVLGMSGQRVRDCCLRLVKRGLLVRLEIPTQGKKICRIIYLPTEYYKPKQ